jgi:hypothetical protein
MNYLLEMPGEYVKLYCDGTRYWVTAEIKQIAMALKVQQIDNAGGPVEGA